MELTYTKCGDYYIPDITLSDRRTIRLADMAGCGCALKGTPPRRLLPHKTLWNHLAEIDAACNERLDSLIPAMAAPVFMDSVIPSRGSCRRCACSCTAGCKRRRRAGRR